MGFCSGEVYGFKLKARFIYHCLHPVILHPHRARRLGTEIIKYMGCTIQG